MICPAEHDTIAVALQRAALSYDNLPLLAVPSHAQRAYHPQGWQISYRDAARTVAELAARYRSAGYGVGHRVGLFLENRPEHMLHKLALNSVGACCVPINGDYRQAELAYVVEHSRMDLVVTLAARRPGLEAAMRGLREAPPVTEFESFERGPARARRPAADTTAAADSPASILYTSGTTGQPKGCVLSHRYELAAGAWYARQGELARIREGCERLYNPLPLFHVNASILSFYCMLLSGGCQVQGERFHPARWWPEVCEAGATIVHYLGVIVPMLLHQRPSPLDRAHSVRFGVGAGVEPQLHRVFEERFGFPLLEIWGMTEIVRVLIDNVPPRQVGTRAFGRAQPGLEVRVADESGQEVAPGQPGEMLLRHEAAQPRKDFFSGYFDDPRATEAAWQGGWFHTGDIVTRDDTGMLHFVDRRKNIIRRSGENIAAAEVEALLLSHPQVEQVAVVAVRDELREEEVLACIVAAAGAGAPRAMDAAARAALARTLFDFCRERLAYYKAPGWILFRDELPTTGTQKLQKHRIFPKGSDPREEPGIVDLRPLKKRG